jgi:hypothetical protein
MELKDDYPEILERANADIKTTTPKMNPFSFVKSATWADENKGDGNAW